MKIIFFGSDEFAVPILKRLVNAQYQVVAVVTQTDKKSGRHLHLSYSAIKKLGLQLNLKILQPERINEPSLIDTLKALQPDLFIVCAYGQILTKELLSIPKIFALNIHASILPKYRGASPINWSLINGERWSGVTTIKMNEFMDKGEIINQEVVEINANDTAISLREKLSIVASSVILKTIDSIVGNTFTLTFQDEKDVTFAPKLKKEDGLIDWNQDALTIYDKIRGLFNWPGAFTYLKGSLLKIYSAKIIPTTNTEYQPGTIIEIDKSGIVVVCHQGYLSIELLQMESGRLMTVEQFICGHKIEIGSTFG